MEGILIVPGFIRDQANYNIEFRRVSSDKICIEYFFPKHLFTNHLMKTYPNKLIHASDEYVGLPKGYQGNSEVGHMAIGSGRIINQSLSRINKSKSHF